MSHKRSISFVSAICILLTAIGCGGDSLQPIDIGDAEFSSPDDYARYDQEMEQLASGQSE